MIQVDMKMPNSCLECDFYANGDSNFLWYGVRIGGKCKRLPIKDLDGDVVDYQVVCKRGKQAGVCDVYDKEMPMTYVHQNRKPAWCKGKYEPEEL